MDVATLRSSFKDNLNRSDCSDTKADMFLGQAVRRVERVLRTPMQKSIVRVVIQPDEYEWVLIPPDYLAMDWIQGNGRKLDRNSAGIGQEMVTPSLTHFYLEGPKLLFRRELAEGDEIRLCYYGGLTTSVTEITDTTVNSVTLIIPDIIEYCALHFAAIHYVDERAPQFEKLFKELVEETQAMSDEDEMAGGRFITNPYAGLI